MIGLHRVQLVLLVFVTLFFFYYFGIESFPDYDNYLAIAQNPGFALSARDYRFEWFSRALLSLDGLSPATRVAVLAFFNQLACLIFLVWAARRLPVDQVYGVLVFFALMGFMLMTTTLRASAAYLSISAFFLRSAKMDWRGILLLLWALAWHDSAAPVLLLCLTSFFIVSLLPRDQAKQNLFFNALKLVVALGLFFVLFPEGLRSSLIHLVDGGGLGARAAYLEGDGAYSLSKSLFLALMVVCAFVFVSDSRQRPLDRIFAVLMVFALAIFNAINAIVAVRFSFYLLAVVLPLRGFMLWKGEKKPEFRLASLIVLPVLYGFGVAYTLSNTR